MDLSRLDCELLVLYFGVSASALLDTRLCLELQSEKKMLL
jgi:hypothetical protein